MFRFLYLTLGLLGVAGCLKEGPQPVGTHLFQGQTVESPSFVQVGGKNMLRFQVRMATPSATSGAVYDLWLVSLDGKEQRRFLANRTDRWGEVGPDSGGGRYLMVNERWVPSAGDKAPVGTLVRLDAGYAETLRIEGVSNFAPFSVPLAALFDAAQPGQSCTGFSGLKADCPQLLFERPPDKGQSYPTLYLWDGTNQIPLGDESGSFQVQHIGNGNSYFILGGTRTLTRLRRPAGTLDRLRDNVARFSVRGDERYVALAVSDPGKSGTVIRDLTTGIEIPLAKPNPSAWQGFGDNSFYYTIDSVGGAPAELHGLDLGSGKDTFAQGPKHLVNIVGSIPRPGSNERLLIDSAGHGVFTGAGDMVELRYVPGPLLTPSFTPDGAYLIYVIRSLATLYDPLPQGALVFQDALLKDPPVTVSPPGLLVGVQNGASYFFTDGDKGQVLAFWSHLGRSSSDLYFADYPGGGVPTNARLVERSILAVSISAHVLFGIVNVSQQDDVGDLVYRDLDYGTEAFYSSAVAEAIQHDVGPTTYVAYVVRGRTGADRSGLWLTPFVQPSKLDGGP